MGVGESRANMSGRVVGYITGVGESWANWSG